MSSSAKVTPSADLAALVGAAQRGDEAAFAGIVLRFQRLAVGLAVGWLGDVELAREAAQEAFLDAHLHLAALRDPAAFVSWFRHIVVKQCDRLTRRRSFWAGVPLSEADALADDAPDPETAVERREEARAVRSALERLPPHERVVVALQYLGGYGQAEIARALGLPLTTVKKRAHDARGRLREELAMVQTTLNAEGTTGLEPFSDHVELFLAIRRGDAAAVGALLVRRPELVSEHEDWPENEAHRARLPYARHATPLIRAAERGDLEIVRLLVEAGAPVNDACGCSTGETALWAAAVTDYPDVVSYLLDRGADPDGRGALGHTALHVAAMRGWPRLVRTLLGHGASPDLRDNAGRTALDWAELKGHAEVAALLRPEALPDGTVAPRRHSPGEAAVTDLCETGIKVIDLFAPLRHGDLVFVDGDRGFGLLVLLGELTTALREGGYGHALWSGFEQPIVDHTELDHTLGESGRRDLARLALVPRRLEPADAQEELGRILDRWDRDLATSTQRRLLVLFQAAGQAASVEALQPRLTRRGAAAATAFVVAPEEFPPRGARRAEALPPGAAAHLRFDAARSRRALFPALKATALTSANLSPESVGAEHAAVAAEARNLLARYERIDPDLVFPEPGALPARQRTTAIRAQRLHAFLTQPLFFAEPFTGKLGVRVPRAATVLGVARILRGELDALPEAELRYIGSL